MSLSQCHYDKPQSHAGTGTVKQTRWVLPAGKKIYAPSIKVLDLKIKPNQDAYLPALVGAYAAVKRVQLKLDNRLVDIWSAQSVLPLLIAGSGDNEKQRGINKMLYASGNNVIYDNISKLLSFDRPVITGDGSPITTQVKLPVYLDLLNNIGIIESAIEIIIDWETDMSKLFLPVDPSNPITDYSIDAPYLAYETLNGDFKQPDKVPYRMRLEEQLAVPAIASSTQQRYEVRSNAFNQKTVGRVLLSNVPANVSTAADVAQLYSVFGSYMSTPMKQENFNVAKDGRLIFSLRNVNNAAVKLSAVHDAWGQSVFVTNAHEHVNASVLKELQGAALNGYASYGAVEINDHISKELQITYMRMSDDNIAYPSLGSLLTINAVAEVKCELVGGLKVYV